MGRIAGPPYRTAEQWHGPCYVLSPEDFVAGWREVIAIIPAIPRRVRQVRIYAKARQVLTDQMRRIITWPRGKPLEWQFEDVPMRKREPGWHTRARELRSRGMSVRNIMRELGIRNRARLDYVLNLKGLDQ